jgi:PRC-barrel domain
MYKSHPGAAIAAIFIAVLSLSTAIGVAWSQNTPPQGTPSQSAPSPQQPQGGAEKTEPAPPPPAPLPPAAATVLPSHEVQSILGREVLSANGENMGRIVDVLVDRSGEVRAAIIDFGGFLGVGSRKIAVEWNALHFPPPAQADAKISLELTRDQVKAAPEYQDGKPVVVLGALGKLEPLPFQ